MARPGTRLVSGRIPGERIATSIATSNSSSFTSHTEVMSVTADLVSGRTYRIRAVNRWSSTVDNDDVIARICEDNTAGTQLALNRDELNADGQDISGQQLPTLEAEYTAASTSSKTFVLTGERSDGTGNIVLNAASDRPCLLYVDYVRG